MTDSNDDEKGREEVRAELAKIIQTRMGKEPLRQGIIVELSGAASMSIQFLTVLAHKKVNKLKKLIYMCAAIGLTKEETDRILRYYGFKPLKHWFAFPRTEKDWDKIVTLRAEFIEAERKMKNLREEIKKHYMKIKRQ